MGDTCKCTVILSSEKEFIIELHCTLSLLTILEFLVFFCDGKRICAVTNPSKWAKALGPGEIVWSSLPTPLLLQYKEIYFKSYIES